MRVLLSLVAGGPRRVCTTAAFTVVIVFVLAGHGMDLARSAWFALLFAAGFVFLFACLAMLAASTGVDDGRASAPAPRETDRG
jgi:hypothetical protein